MASIIQNISQNRANKKINIKDLNYARAAAGLVYYGGKTQYTVSANLRPKGSFLEFYLYYVKGTGHNIGKVIWAIDGNLFLDTPDNIAPGMRPFSYDSQNSIVRYKANDTASQEIYKNLKIEKDEAKIVLDIGIIAIGNIPLKSIFELWVFSPKSRTSNNAIYFSNAIIFTPKPGLFDETPPS